MALAWGAEGVFEALSVTISIPSMSPIPRTSPTFVPPHHVLERRLEAGALHRRVLDEALLLEDADVGEADGAPQEIAGMGRGAKQEAAGFRWRLGKAEPVV